VHLVLLSVDQLLLTCCPTLVLLQLLQGTCAVFKQANQGIIKQHC
jgi:hypothetical protein